MGLKTQIDDLRAVVSFDSAGRATGTAVLLGHSLGASIVEEYAAWDFAGTAGYSELAGLVLVDGTAREEGKASVPYREDEYVNGLTGGSFGKLSLTKVRQSDRLFRAAVAR